MSHTARRRAKKVVKAASRTAAPRKRRSSSGRSSSSRSKSSSKRRYAPRMPPEERREQVFDATLTLIAENGYESVSMEAVARAAGVTKPVVYDLFGSLTNLLDELLEREEERALVQLAELLPTPSENADPEELLVDGLKAFLRSVEARPDAWKVILTPPAAMPGQIREIVENERTKIASQLEQIVRWGLEQLDTAIEDVELLVDVMITLVEEAARQHLADPERYPIDRLAEFTASLLASVRR